MMPGRMYGRRMRTFAGLLLCLVLTSCASVSEGVKDGVKEGGDKPEGSISRADLGAEWPLTVESGTLGCDGQDGVGSATFTTGGEKYALNGTAKGRKDGVAIDPIWAADPSIPGAKKNIGVLIDRALQLCK